MSTYSPAPSPSGIEQVIANYVATMVAFPDALRGQQLRGGGAVAEFETLLAERCGFPYCVATNNATSALIALAVVLAVRGRSVFFPRNHWEGSVAAFRLMGARIKRYDPEKVLRCPPPRSGKPAVAVIVGSYHLRINHSSVTILIEDSCRLPGVSVPVGTGSFADVKVLSFGPGKSLSLGEGGAALFRSKMLYRKFVAVSQHPERVSAEFSWRGSMPRMSLNARIHPVAALLGCMLLNKTGLDQSPK